MKVCTKVTMRLESDAIFGSGYSIPGGEDIGVKTDEYGLPYLSGSTFKGLLREEVENLLEWRGETAVEETLEALFGQVESWHGASSPRQIFLSPLTLPKATKNWKVNRTFTSVDPETGTVKEGTLRIAACIRKGMEFQGQLICQEADKKLLEDAVGCLKYVGTSRTRGFGRVKVTMGTWEPVVLAENTTPAAAEDYLTYRLYLKEPVRVTDRTDSHDTFLGCLGHLPANAVRGYVLHALAEAEPEWFQANKVPLLRQVCFADAVPCNKEMAVDGVVLPALKGFYEDKLEQKFYSILHTKDVEEGTKRAKLGSFCTISPVSGREGCMEIQGWSAKTRVETRIALKGQKMFQTEQLSPEQTFAGCVVFHDCSQEIKEKVSAALSGELRLGASIHAGTGLCQVQDKQWRKEAPECAAFGYQQGETLPKTLYLLLLSPLALLDERGQLCGADCETFQRLLGVPVKEVFCSTSVIQVPGFNRTWGARMPTVAAYDRGSMFRLECETAPDWETIRRLERDGLGLRREEGFGRIVFLRDFEQVTQKKPKKAVSHREPSKEAVLRRNRLRWLNDTDIPEGLSDSQMGDLQAKWEGLRNAVDLEMVRDAMEAWFAKIRVKNAEFRDKYEGMHDFVLGVFQDNAELPLAHPEKLEERINLLSDLFNLNRKEEI